jgi:thiol-disulfide isomerase/thioredoxin
MKNLIYIVITLFFSIFGIAQEKITLSGKILNVKNTFINIQGEQFSKEINLNKDGSFSSTFEINYNGRYLLVCDEDFVNLFFDKNSKLYISGDSQKLKKSIIFKGIGSIENSYIQQKNELIKSKIGDYIEFYSKEESDYINKVKEIKNEITTLYNATNFTNSFFKIKEKRSIDYFEQLNYLVYEGYHGYNIKNEKFKISENFPKINPNLDLENVEDYLFSSEFETIVYKSFDIKIEKLVGKNADFSSKFAIPEIKNIKNKYFQNKLLNSITQEISPSNPDSENLYNELLLLIKNEGWRKEITEKFNKIKELVTGKPSPVFDYENFKGGKTSLESLKGKYVYIDVWATWCGPCREEIPHLQKLEEDYKGKNIEFVSISVDQKKDYDKWHKMIEEKSLRGQQLFADNDWQSKFVQDYAVEGIPRFILLDTEGKIINADAPRPSDPKLIENLKELGL